jgi:hypothetical protein
MFQQMVAFRQMISKEKPQVAPAPQFHINIQRSPKATGKFASAAKEVQVENLRGKLAEASAAKEVEVENLKGKLAEASAAKEVEVENLRRKLAEAQRELAEEQERRYAEASAAKEVEVENLKGKLAEAIAAKEVEVEHLIEKIAEAQRGLAEAQRGFVEEQERRFSERGVYFRDVGPAERGIDEEGAFNEELQPEDPFPQDEHVDDGYEDVMNVSGDSDARMAGRRMAPKLSPPLIDSKMLEKMQTNDARPASATAAFPAMGKMYFRCLTCDKESVFDSGQYMGPR